MSKRCLYRFLAGFLFLVFVGCCSLASAAPLRVAVLPYLSFAPMYIAQAEGYFEQQGVPVEFVKFQSNSESLAALLTGRLDVGSIFTVGLLNAIARGEMVRVVANKGVISVEACPADGFMARSELLDDLQEPTAEQMKHLKFGVDPAWLDSFFLEQVLVGVGLTYSDVTTSYVANPAARMEALASGNLDVAFFSEPWIRRVQENGGGEMWKPVSEIIPGFPLGVITFGPSLLKQDKEGDLGVRFLRAYLQGITQFNEGKTPRNIEILSAATKLEPALLERICWPSFAEQGLIEAELISRYSEWAVQQGLADRALRADEFWEPRFVDQAANDLAGKP